MIYPNPIRQFDNLDGAELRPCLHVRYSVVNLGTTHTGEGLIRDASSDEALALAMILLKMACPECKGYTNHRVEVESQ